MTEKIRKKPYEARVEYRAVREEVDQLLAAGHSIHAVYERLTAAGRLTICYSAFCDYVRGQGERRHKKQGRPPVSKQPSSPVTAKKPEPDRSSTFVHERNVDLKELI